MSLVPFTFTNVELKIVVIDSKAWTPDKEVCQALQYKKKTNDVLSTFVSKENKQHKYELQGRLSTKCPANWPKDSQK